MIRLLAGLIAVALSIAVSSNAAFAQTPPHFVLGFKTLHDMIPNIVGQPLENEHFNPQNGDSLQRTTNGLLVWRKADNFTAFTDGSTTWINGPFGLQSRSNNTRFPWEPPQSPTPAPQPAAPAPSPPAPSLPRPPSTGPAVPHPDNWAGYVATRFNTGQNYASIGGTWVVPGAKEPPGLRAGFSATWIGIGGACLDSQCTNVDPTLIQIGTEQDAAHGNTQYLAWYEMLPEPSVTITSLVINPGDKVQASIQMVKGNRNGTQTWQLSLVNTTTGQSWNKTVQYQSSLASADWIEEAPFAGSVLPLADFGTVTLGPLQVNGANPHLVPGEEAVMLNPNGQVANVSAPNAAADAFKVCFGTSTNVPASCPAPGS